VKPFTPFAAHLAPAWKFQFIHAPFVQKCVSIIGSDDLGPRIIGDWLAKAWTAFGPDFSSMPYKIRARPMLSGCWLAIHETLAIKQRHGNSHTRTIGDSAVAPTEGKFIAVFWQMFAADMVP